MFVNSRIRFKSFKFLFLFLSIFAVLIYVLFFFNNFNFFIQNSHIYTIIIDAGSTGSRIHVFRLRKSHDKESESMPYHLVSQDLFFSIKPGLSSFADQPSKAAESIKPLLDKALSVVPAKEHHITRIMLKATAGLRLISDSKANKILDTVNNLFDSYPFYRTKNDVAILDGNHEGIYSWLTLNYAKNSFNMKEEREICTLDLGGGSTQLTFMPKESITLLTASKDNLVDFRIDDNIYKIYTKSYLGYGMMSARLEIFNVEVFKTNNLKENYSLSSVCLTNKNEYKWMHQNIEYTVKGTEKKQQNFADCLDRVKRLVENKFNAPVELRKKQIYAFSFYYDRLKNAQIIDEYGGRIKIEFILTKTKEICDNANNIIGKDSEFLCMDLTYIYVLLTQGLGMNTDQFINVHKEINQMEINWALGAAFHMLND